jgi:hypothetical protein
MKKFLGYSLFIPSIDKLKQVEFKKVTCVLTHIFGSGDSENTFDVLFLLFRGEINKVLVCHRPRE